MGPAPFFCGVRPGEKFRNYRRFETLHHYLMVKQGRRQVEYY